MLGACFGAEVVIITLLFASVILAGWQCGLKEGREVSFGLGIVGAELVGWPLIVAFLGECYFFVLFCCYLSGSASG